MCSASHVLCTSKHTDNRYKNAHRLITFYSSFYPIANCVRLTLLKSRTAVVQRGTHGVCLIFLSFFARCLVRCAQPSFRVTVWLSSLPFAYTRPNVARFAFFVVDVIIGFVCQNWVYNVLVVINLNWNMLVVSIQQSIGNQNSSSINRTITLIHNYRRGETWIDRKYCAMEISRRWCECKMNME